MGFGIGWVGEAAASPGDELLEPGRGPSVEAPESLLDDIASFHPPICADRGFCQICHTQVRGVVVQRRAILVEQPAEPRERPEATAVAARRAAEGPPGHGG